MPEPYDHFKPPAHFTPRQGRIYRLGLTVLVFVIMGALAYWVGPWIQTNVGEPFGDWVYDIVRGWTGEPYRPRD